MFSVWRNHINYKICAQTHANEVLLTASKTFLAADEPSSVQRVEKIRKARERQDQSADVRCEKFTCDVKKREKSNILFPDSSCCGYVQALMLLPRLGRIRSNYVVGGGTVAADRRGQDTCNT